MGSCVLWMLGVHGGTRAVCRVYSVFIILGLDVTLVPFYVKVALSAGSMLAPLFPPKKTPEDYMLEWRAHIAKHKSLPVEKPNRCRVQSRQTHSQSQGCWSFHGCAAERIGYSYPSSGGA